MRAYKKIKDGELVRPKMDGYKIGCCDCGLVHKLVFYATKRGNVTFRAYRDEKATNLLRKKMVNEKETRR